MRKQIFAGLIGAVALLFSVVALTSSPAAGEHEYPYTAHGADLAVNIVDPAPCGGPISGAVTGGTAPYTVTVVTNAATMSTTLTSAGSYAFGVPAGASGTYTFSVTDGAGNSAGGSGSLGTQVCTTTGGGSGSGGGTGGGGSVPAGSVVTAAQAGFTNGIPTQPGGGVALAVTGSETNLLGFIATGLIALGAVAMGSRRKFLQGALQD